MNVSFLQYAIGIAYMGLGAYVYHFQTFVVPLDDMIATSLALLLFFYGIFRISRAYLKSKKNEH